MIQFLACIHPLLVLMYQVKCLFHGIRGLIKRRMIASPRTWQHASKRTSNSFPCPMTRCAKPDRVKVFFSIDCQEEMYRPKRDVSSFAAMNNPLWLSYSNFFASLSRL